MKKRTLAFILSMTMAIALLAGCGSSGDGKNGEKVSKETKTIDSSNGVIEAAAAEEQVDKLVTTLNTASFDTSPFATPSAANIIRPLMYATLIYSPYYGAPLEECQMWLAESVTKADDYTYDIKLHENITDSKGNNIDADDVIFGYEMSKERAQFLAVGTDAEYIKKTGDYSLQIKTTTKAPGVIESLLSSVQLCIVDKEWYETASDEELQNDPAVTGAYAIKEIVAGSSVTFEAVDDYWMPEDVRPIGAYQNVKEIEFKVITEDSMRAIALENGEVDLTLIKNSTELQRFYSGGKAVDGYNVSIDWSPTCHSMFLNMDSGKSVLADSPELRKAALHAVNSEDILLASGNTLETAQIMNAFGTKVQNGYLEEWDDEDYFSYDAEKAQKYLEDAGYKKGEVTLRVLTCVSLYNDSVRSALIANLEAAGFKVDSLAVDQALFNTYKNDSTQWDIIIDSKISQTGSIVGLWDSCFNPSGYTNGSVCFTHDDQLVKLLGDTANVSDEASFRAFQSYLNEQAICKGLYTGMGIAAAQNGIIQIAWGSSGAVYYTPNAMVFAADYKSVGSK